MTNRRASLAERFWSRVDKTDGCWAWTGTVESGGYGALSWEGHKRRAPRLSWELHYGPIPPGLFVCHHCDNPPCVRPDHLFVGTLADNNHDRDAKGRQVSLSGERHGMAKLTSAWARVIKASTESHAALARLYGVDESTVRAVRTGEAWRAAQPPVGDE